MSFIMYGMVISTRLANLCKFVFMYNLQSTCSGPAKSGSFVHCDFLFIYLFMYVIVGLFSHVGNEYILG